MSKKMPHLKFYKDRKGEWRWQLRAPNGRVIASGEGFTSEAKARNSWALVAKYAYEAAVMSHEPVQFVRLGRA